MKETKMNWTKEQQEAIELRNKNILVAAAAGSGKTAVLVERIKRLILEEKCPVDRMLIVTFTNAAAAEMKEKIHKSITSTINDLALSLDGDADAEKTEAVMGKSTCTQLSDLQFLKKQLSLLPTANISTFHAFALDVIRRYFYIIQIEPNFKICDTTQETLLKGEAMDELLDELFEADKPEFYHFLKCYSGDRNENRFREIIDNCYNTIRSLPEPFAWLREAVEQLKDGRALKDGKLAETLYETAESKLKIAMRCMDANIKIEEETNLDGFDVLCQKDKSQLALVADAVASRNYEAIRQAARDFKLPTLQSKIFKEEPELKEVVSSNRNIIKKQIKDLKEVYFGGDFDELCREMALTYDSALYLEKLLKRYDRLYKLKKAEKNLADFGDIEHYAYEILKDKEAGEFYRNRFNHIFIDEYQDSNVIQEALIDLIKRPNNLFMVGDVKQSIYKFRLAEPEIFQNKYKSYEDGSIPDSQKIDLNKNFRSKKKVVDFINAVCEDTMAGYDDNAKLYLGDPYGDESYDEPKLYLCQVPWDENTELDDEIKNIIKAEKEAMAAAKIIADNVGTEIFDSKLGRKRTLEMRDIVILMRGVRNYGDIFYRVLAENNLPAYVDDNEGFFNTMEVDAFMSALYIIDNPKQDIPLMTLLRSEMLGFTIEEMVQVRLHCKDGSYYDAFTSFANDVNAKCSEVKHGEVQCSEEALIPKGEINASQSEHTDGEVSQPNIQTENLRAKCKDALDKIQSWRELSKIMPLDRLIWKLMLDTGFYIAMGAMPAGSQRQANLRALTDKALAYQSGKDSSLYGFIRYIEAIKEKKVSMGQVKILGEKDDLIRIMTVHKSKGLEFPMVLLAGYSRRLNYSTAGKSPMIHKDLGIGFPLVNPEKKYYKTTLMQSMMKDRFHREEVDEEKRILYVALTRAKDKLMLLGMVDDIEADLAGIKTSSPKDSSYFEMTGKTIASLPSSIAVVGDNDLLSLSKGRRRNAKAILDTMEAAKGTLVSPEIEKLMTFEYPFADNLKVRTKYSVSQLNSHGRKTIDSLGDPKFMQGDDDVSAASRGTIYHSVLEHMDIARASREGRAYIQELIQDMIAKEMITPQESQVVDISRLEDFAASELAGRIAASKLVKKEQRFNLMTMHEGHNVMVRGIIDCYFEEESEDCQSDKGTDVNGAREFDKKGELVLLDYKTGNVRDAKNNNDDAIRERYKVQMNLYKEALEGATGKKVKEAYLYLTDVGKIVKM